MIPHFNFIVYSSLGNSRYIYIKPQVQHVQFVLTCLPVPSFIRERICFPQTSPALRIHAASHSGWPDLIPDVSCHHYPFYYTINWIVLSCWLKTLQRFPTKPKITTNSFLWPTESWMVWTCLAQATLSSVRRLQSCDTFRFPKHPKLRSAQSYCMWFLSLLYRTPPCLCMVAPFHSAMISLKATSWGRPSLMSKVDLPPQPTTISITASCFFSPHHVT